MDTVMLVVFAIISVIVAVRASRTSAHPLGFTVAAFVMATVATFALFQARRTAAPFRSAETSRPRETGSTVDPDVMRLAPLVGILQIQNEVTTKAYCIAADALQTVAASETVRPDSASNEVFASNVLQEAKRDHAALCAALQSVRAERPHIDAAVKAAATIPDGLHSFRALIPGGDPTTEEPFFQEIHVGPFLNGARCADVEALAHASLLPTRQCQPTTKSRPVPPASGRPRS